MSEDQKGALSISFLAIAPDDAMAPRARKGEELYFRSDVEPRFGDGVIVRDGQGGLYFRQYREGPAAGVWVAHALNEAYRSLRSDTHDLEVVAVLRVPEKGWADL